MEDVLDGDSTGNAGRVDDKTWPVCTILERPLAVQSVRCGVWMLIWSPGISLLMPLKQ